MYSNVKATASAYELHLILTLVSIIEGESFRSSRIRYMRCDRSTDGCAAALGPDKYSYGREPGRRRHRRNP